MEISFLTPLGAVFALAALVPISVFLARERRASRQRAHLGLREPSPRSRVSLAAALAAVCGLLALAAAQPVVATSRTLDARTDAEVFVVLDTSRSMLASAGPGAPTRFDRGRTLIDQLSAGLPELPVGVASLTDRVLPHLFPTTDRRVLSATLEKTLSVESPGPSSFFAVRATTFDALAVVPRLAYFKPNTEKRVLVVVTDGESRPLVEDLAGAFDMEPTIDVIFVRLWDAAERIYVTGAAEVGYEPDEESEAMVAELASLLGAQVVEEGEAATLPQTVARLFGDGPTVEREHEGRRRALMPWITLAAVFPLGFVLVRRNL